MMVRGAYLGRVFAPRFHHEDYVLGGFGMVLNYDPSIIHTHAVALYRRAARIVYMAAFLGFVFGAIAGSGLGAPTGGKIPVFAVAGGIFGALIGVSVGRARAFVFQLQAQLALCQVAIEANTRRAAEVATAEATLTPHAVSRVG